MKPSLALIVAAFLLLPALRAADAQETPRRPPVDMFGPAADPTVTWTAFSETEGTQQEDVWEISPEKIVCKGSPRGYLRTKQDFTDFILELDWRWPQDGPGKGGVLIRMTGKDKIWPRSLEAQINAGDAGDFWGLDGFRLAGPEPRMKSLESEQFGTLTHLKKTDPCELPAGQWNHYEIIARQGSVILKVNGREVNRTTSCDAVAGKICLTSEGSEIHFRNVKIVPLGEP
ncbi:MAG: 3-keto-disaccharide hydrolase [Thermoguttaceae bacterium]